MEFQGIILLVFIIIGIFAYYNRKQEDEEAIEVFEKNRKEDLKELYENISIRENLELFDEEKFWELIDYTKDQSRGDYQNQIGLIKDRVNHYSTEDLVKLDNLLNHLIKEAFTWDLYGASSIIFKSQEIGNLVLLISMLISRGQVIYNNSLVNPNVLVNQDFGQIKGVIINDVFKELYVLKTNELMPEVKDFSLDLTGEEWQQSQLPSKFPEIWDRFA